MNIPIIRSAFPLWCLCISIGCTQPSQQISDRSNPQSPTKAFLRGEKPAPLKAKHMDPDSIAPPVLAPLKGQPKVVPAHANVHPVGTPEVKQIPEKLQTITFGKEGVPPARTFPAKGKVVPAKHPVPIPAKEFRTKDAAIYNIQFLSDEQGLKNPHISTMMEDSRGHIWFGVTHDGNGVYRYDGENFFHYTTEDGFLLSYTGSIIEDRNGNIWMSGLGGVCYYDGQNFVHFTSEEGLGRKRASAIMEDREGNIWFYSKDLYRFDGENFTIYEMEQAFGMDAKDRNTWYDINDITEIIEDRRGHLWLATGDNGVLRFDGQNMAHLADEEGLVDNYIGNILEDREGNIWFGSGARGTPGKGVSRYTPDLSMPFGIRGTLTNYNKNNGLSGNKIREILEDAAGNIWFATFGAGINRFDGKNFTHFTKEEGMSFDGILSLMEDSQGNLWAGSNGGGISKFVPNSFQHFTEIEKVLMEDGQDNIWMAQPYGGVVKYDGQNMTTYTVENGLLHRHVSGMLEDRHGNIWFMYNQGKGLSRFDGKTFAHYTTKQGLINKYSADIYEDTEGIIWIAGGWENVTRLDPKTGQITHFLGNKREGIGGAEIFEDKQQNLWFGGQGYLAKHDKENDQLEFVCQIDTQEGGWVEFIREDKSGNLWVGTNSSTTQISKDGVVSKDSFPRFSKGSEMPDVFIRDATYDRDGNLWITTRESGIAVFLNGMKNIGQPDFKWIQYGKSDGLKSTRYRFSKILLDSKNKLWMSNTATSVAILDLNHYRLPTEPPKNLGLFQIQIQQQHIDYGRLSDTSYSNSIANGGQLTESFDSVVAFQNYPSDLALPYNLNHLTFHFSATDWAAPHKIQYSFKLDGIDQDWSHASNEAKADYRNLPYGRFTFHVKAIGDAKIWSKPLNYTFTIRPPWWHTWWAYCLYALLVLGAVGGYIMRLRNKIREKQAQLDREQYLNRELRELNIATTRFVPADFVKILNKDTLKELKLGDQTLANMTVLFADIRDYTGLSEQMTPEENFKFINAYLGRMGPIIQEHGGFICQYYGDGIMALFKDNHDLAVRAAIKMQEALQRYNRKRFARNRPVIRVGIGLNTGQLMLGVIGDERRYDTSVISDAVNTASRMEGLTKIFGCQVIVSEKTLMELKIFTEEQKADTLGGDYRFLGVVKVKGKERALKIYDFYDGETEEVRHFKTDTKVVFEKALQFYYDRLFGKAADLFKIVLEKYPGDKASKYYMNRSVKYIMDGVDERWTGAEEMVSK